jgi:hypothetical protein
MVPAERGADGTWNRKEIASETKRDGSRFWGLPAWSAFNVSVCLNFNSNHFLGDGKHFPTCKAGILTVFLVVLSMTSNILYIRIAILYFTILTHYEITSLVTNFIVWFKAQLKLVMIRRGEIGEGRPIIIGPGGSIISSAQTNAWSGKNVELEISQDTIIQRATIQTSP